MRILSLLLAAALVFMIIDLGRAGQGRFLLEGGEVALDLGEGRVLRRDSLIGLILVVANGNHDVQVRIDGIDTDASRPGQAVTLYRTSLMTPGGAPTEACAVDPQGRRAAFLYPGESGRFSFTCTSGAEGKCILFGYRPWEHRGRIPMRDLHRACVHMLRADYGGDDRPTTRDGTQINIYDRFGIQEPSVAPAMRFEAAWGPDGAVCVAHPRIAEHVTLDQLAKRYPRLEGRLGPDACTEDAMRIHPGALILNASVPTGP